MLIDDLGLGVDVGVGVAVGAGIGVDVGAGVGVDVGCGVGVSVGSTVGDGIGVTSGVGLGSGSEGLHAATNAATLANDTITRVSGEDSFGYICIVRENLNLMRA